VSGIALGEMLHRITALILNNQTNPAWWRQTLAGVINPGGYGLNRLLQGNTIYSRYKHDPIPYLAGLSFGGGPRFSEDFKVRAFPQRFIRFHMIYGNPFAKQSSFKPFDNFTFVSTINVGVSDYVGEIYTSGMLLPLYQIHRNSYESALGVFQNYDFMNHDDYKVSSTSIGLGYLHHFRPGYRYSYLAQTAFSLIILGSAGDTDDDGIGRDYHFGPGYSGKIILKIISNPGNEVYLRLKRYFIFAKDNRNFNGYENINLLNAGYQIKLFKSYSLGGELTIAARKSVNQDTDETSFIRTGAYRLYLIYYINSSLFE